MNLTANILIVEDEPIIAEDLKMIVSKAGYKVIGIANDGITALELLYSRSPDIVLMDIALEGNMTGIDVAHIINEKYKLPFIFITSFMDDMTLDMANEVLPSGYITKPFKKKDILANIKISLHRASNNKLGQLLTLDEINNRITSKLSKHEYEIVMNLCVGTTNQKISEIYGVSINTVKTQLKRIFIKLDVTNRAQIASKLQRGS